MNKQIIHTFVMGVCFGICFTALLNSLVKGDHLHAVIFLVGLLISVIAVWARSDEHKADTK